MELTHPDAVAAANDDTDGDGHEIGLRWWNFGMIGGGGGE